MVFNKKLLVKVAGGLSTAVGTSSVIAWKLSGSTNEAEVNVNGERIEIKAKEDKDVNKLRQQKKVLKTNELGIPEECKSDQVTDKITQKCQLIDDQIEKINFDKENNGKKISVGPLSWSKELNLTIEYTDNTEHFPDNKKYIFTNELKDENDKDVKISNIKGGDVVLEKNGAGVEFRKTRSGNKLERSPLEDKFGIPIDCKSYKVTEGKPSQTCQLTAEQLKKVKFEGVVKNQVKVNSLGNNKVDLIISDASTDRMNYPEGKKYTFINKNNDPVIIDVSSSKDKSIVLEKDKEITFREKDGDKLEKFIEINELGISRECEKTECDLDKEVLTKIKFDGFNNETTTVEGLDYGEKIRLNVKGSSYIFMGADQKVTIKNGNQSVEFKVGYYSYYEKDNGKLKKQKEENKFNELGIPSTCNFETNNKECVLDFDDLKNINFSIKGSGKLTITPSNSFGKKIPLRIEYAGEDKEYTDGIKYIFNFKDIKEDLTISGTETNNTIKFDGERDEEIWFKKNKDGKLEKNDTTPKVDSLGIPVWFGFEKDSNTKEYDLEIKYLEKIKFYMEESGDLKATITEGNPTIKLIREKVKSEDYEAFKNNSTKHIFKVTGGNVKVSNGREEIHFKKGMDLEFKKDNNKLKRAWDDVELGKRVGLACGGKHATCAASDRNASIKVLDGSEIKEGDMKKGRYGSKNFMPYKDQEGYNQGIKLVPVEDIPLNSGGKLTKGDSFEIKYHDGKKGWYLTKVNPQEGR